ncbi:AEC family transporter [Planococcus sp. 1R117A]|uniref:AEC family transporter n=1 Tax=Planococcus sp. 1R117A TaxID=3447020 RepID=UPI003EDC5FC5
MMIFTEVVLPVLLIFLAGFGLQKWKRLDIKPFSTVAIYILTPMLVFQNVYTASLDQQYANMVIFSLILLALLIFLSKLYCFVRKKGRSTESALILSTAFMNSGNYGAPIVLFAYGQQAFGYAISLMVIHIIFMNFFGIYYAARGAGGVKTAMKAVFEMPPTYAVLLAVFFKLFDYQVPENILSVVDLLAPATVPVIMVILGMQLAEINLSKLEWEKVSFAVILRLFISPAIAFGILLVMPMDPLLAKVLILISAMPSAANTVIYAVQYDSEPNLVSSITLITTLLSILTVTWMLILLG